MSSPAGRKVAKGFKVDYFRSSEKTQSFSPVDGTANIFNL